MIEQSHIQKFAAVYAEAVLTFLDSGEAQWLAWDGHSHRFDFASVEMDEPQVPVMLFVDAGWTQVLGDIGEVIDPESPHFDIDALRAAIEEQIADEGFGERLLKGFQERLERLASAGEDEEDEEADKAPEPPDVDDS
ncbi:MAG TPA: hypothetical protein VM074_12040 [Solimonas sp.]|nr:hypothetical protein [Solimonas sp.]